MRIELEGNYYVIRATPEEMLEHIAALTHSVRNVINGYSSESASSRPIVATEAGQQVPRSLRTVIERPNV
jgi:hypothetical protein